MSRVFVTSLSPLIKSRLTCLRQEFANLDDDANIYKLVGPILLKQDVSEAKSTVDGRLEFIDKEMYLFFCFPSSSSH